jgi:ATP-dependent DNA helicase RecQ
MAMRRRLVESDADGRAPDPERVQHRWNLFLELMRWAEGGSCRHDAILRYFGDEAETLAGCGRCDVCLNLADNDGSDPEEVTLLVRKALSAVARIHGRFGLNAAAKLLRGADDDRLIGARLTETKTFGILSDRSDEWLTRLLRRCVTAGWVDFFGDERPVVILTESGAAVMKGERPARILLPPATSAKTATRSARTRGGNAVATDEETLDETGLQLFEILRGHRLQLARDEGVPPYVVASDRALRDIARLRPRTLDELMLAHGIGPSKAEKYGVGILGVISSSTETDRLADGGDAGPDALP